MIVEFDSHQLAGPLDRTCELDVLGRGIETATGMIAGENETEGQVRQRRKENLSRMSAGRVERAVDAPKSVMTV